METLSRKFSDRIFTYEQVERHGDLAIYTQTHNASGVVRYELVIIRVQHAHPWPDGTVAPEREGYPSSRQWGHYGWTFFTLGEARAALAQRLAVA